MNKIRWIILIMLCLLQIAQKLNAMDKEDPNCTSIKEALKAAALLPKSDRERDIVVNHLKDAGGSGNNGIYEIVKGEQQYIGKAVQGGYGNKPVKDQITSHIDLNTKEDPNFKKSVIDHFNQQENFPKFVKYLGVFKAKINQQEESILVLEKALGISLKQFGKENSKKKSLDSLKPHLERMGTTLGKFQAFENEGWDHGDLTSNSDNVFYEEKSGILTLIDYDQLKRKSDEDKKYCKQARNICLYIFKCFSDQNEKEFF